MAKEETQEKGNDGLPVEIERLVRPDFMEDPVVFGIGFSSIGVEHEYKMLTEGERVIEALTWMISVYDDVRVEDGLDDFASLIGDVRKV